MSGYVCNNLMVNIFEGLPPKSIIRFRSLSKYWHSRLRSPEFIHDHRIRCSKNPPKVLIKHVTCWEYTRKIICTSHSADQLPVHPGSGYIGIPAVEFHNQGRLTEVVGSCNGILCLRDKENIILWNFSIRRKLVIPLHPLLKSTLKPFDGAFGFGFDPITDDYKIVGALLTKKTYIYCLKTKSWCEIVSPYSTSSFVNLLGKACFINGILHWVMSTVDPRCFILTFNVSSHVFGRILFPEPWRVSELTTINGCLALASLEKGYYRKIRVMEEYDKTESWTVLFEVEIKGQFHVIQPTTNGDVLVAYNVQSKVYNLRTMSFTKLLLKFGPCRYNIEMETYVESLELLDKDNTVTCGETIFSSA
ncbi:putative F-box domain-containing protein [Helianthus annuus]|nr:putative F-box domain-containing protein [Helianthus annuus]